MAEYNESQINSNETERISAEQERINNETQRQTNETEREARESTRQSNESTRISEYNTFMADVHNAEDERIANENERVQAEASRVTAENSRVEAENSRAEFYDGFNDRLDAVDSQLEHIITQVYNVKDYGAKGDGVTDDSEAILRAVSSMRKNNVELYFPPGIYIHGDGVTTGFSYTAESEGSSTPIIDSSTVNIGRDIRIILEGFENVVINGYGAEIRSNDNNGECRNNAIMKFIDCKNVVVKGLKFNGRREQRKPKFNDYSVESSAERGNLHICRCDKVTLKDIESINAMMDGICVYGNNETSSTNVDITNCICNYNYRQGLTLSMVEKCNINGGHYSYNGHDGTMPKSGIDIEADWGGVGNKHIHINGIYCVDNASSNLIFATGLDGCNVTNCYFEGRTLSSHETARNITVRDCRFNNCALSGSININYFNNICEYSFLDTDIISNTFSHIIIDYADTSNLYGVQNAYFKGNKIICDLSNVPSNFQGRIGFIRTTLPIPLVFEDNVIINSLDCTETYVFMFNGCKELKNNTFIYNSELNFENKSNIIQGIFRNNNLDYKRISSNNIINGYNDDQFNYTIDTVVDLEGKQQSNIFLDAGINGKLYKINNGEIFTEIVTHNTYNNIANLTLNYMSNEFIATKNTTTPYIEFYKDSLNNYYIAPLEDYVLVEITRLALGYNKKIKNNEPLLVLTDIDKSTLTKIEYSS